MGPHPRCVIWHWAACHESPSFSPDGASASLKRFRQLRSDYDFARKYGLGVLRDSIRAALRGEKLLNFSYYLIGAAFWPQLDGLFARILQNLNAQEPELRVVATFACAYYMEQEQVACLIAERAVVEEGDALTLQATREVLEIGASLQFGGTCPRCGRRRTTTTPQLEDLNIETAAQKESRP